MNLEDAQKEMQITVHRFVKNNSQYSVVGNITALQILRTWELLQKREELYGSVEKGVEIHKIKLVPLISEELIMVAEYTNAENVDPRLNEIKKRCCKFQIWK